MYDGSFASEGSSPEVICSRRIAAICREGGTGPPCTTIPKVIPIYPEGDNHPHGVVRCRMVVVGYRLVAEDYGLNIGRFIHEHPGWLITAGFEGYGFAARRRDSDGRASGKPLSALTLDELAELIEDSV
jgi:hypothetical protein